LYGAVSKKTCSQSLSNSVFFGELSRSNVLSESSILNKECSGIYPDIQSSDSGDVSDILLGGGRVSKMADSKEQNA
jgi:hypothetical protein